MQGAPASSLKLAKGMKIDEGPLLSRHEPVVSSVLQMSKNPSPTDLQGTCYLQRRWGQHIDSIAPTPNKILKKTP